MAGIPKQIKNNLFTVGERIGKGASGDVYKAKMNNGKEVAIKFESRGENIRHLQGEISVYQKLNGKQGFAKLIAHGRSSGYDFMAMELLGQSLETVFKAHGGPFGLATVSKIGVELLDRLQVLHAENIVHCDLKPENVIFGTADQTTLYLIDFGLSKTILNADELLQPFKINRIVGTFNYLSVGAHEGIVSFRNDIESLAYMLIYLISGDLPWNLKSIVKNLNNLEVQSILSSILELKKAYTNNPQKQLPPPIECFLKASQNITHVQRPNYEELREILRSDDFSHFDWEENKENIMH